MKILVGGGAGFIGSHYVDLVLADHPEDEVVVVDLLTYSGRRENLSQHQGNPRFSFVQADIADGAAIDKVIGSHGIDAIVNFAAESHVDRSLQDPKLFLKTNIDGVHNLLEATRRHQLKKYVQVSTDEVYGQVLEGSSKETDPLDTRSPYSATKAAGDLLARSYFVSFGIPVSITRGSNTYGPRQFPEKLIPLATISAIKNLPIPRYGKGDQWRDWLHASDHARGVDLVLRQGSPGEIYNIGGGNLRQNQEILELVVKTTGKNDDLITEITDRAGHDFRYHVDTGKIERQLGWKPQVPFETGMTATVKWYLDNESWWLPVWNSPDFQSYYQRSYAGKFPKKS